MTAAVRRRSGRASTLLAALAVASVGTVVFAFYLIVGGRLAPLDPEAVAVGRDLARELPREAVATITALGAFPVALTLVAAFALLLRARGQAGVGIALLAGFLLLALAVQLVKLGVGRVRPPGHDPSLVTASYPSAHAAQATTWTAVAVVASSLLVSTKRRAVRIAVVGAGLLVTLLVGLTRLVLGAHYWSDVAGGWGLGAAFFGLVAALLVTVGSMRHTRRRAADRPPGDPIRTTP